MAVLQVVLDGRLDRSTAVLIIVQRQRHVSDSWPR
jgi:hypothetical protein